MRSAIRVLAISSVLVLFFSCHVLASTRITRQEDRVGCTRSHSSRSYVNQLGVAWLSWNDDQESPLVNLGAMPTGYACLFVQLKKLDEISGYEFCVRWSRPGAPEEGCYSFVGSFASRPDADRQRPLGSWTNQFEAAAGCSPDSWREAFAYQKCETDRTSGVVSHGVYNFANCSTAVPGAFELEYVKVADCSGRVTNLEVIGGVTILGGSIAASPLSAEQTTWGTLKAKYQPEN